MHITDLIRHFSEKTALPIDVNDVLTCLKDNGSEDDIAFVGVDLDPEILLGQVKIWHGQRTVYGEPIRFVNVYYNRTQSIDWQRIISCKELLHTLDANGAKTRSKEDVRALAEKIGLPPEMQDPLSDGFAANVDRLAEWRAVAILFPLAARNVLMPRYLDKTITVSDIARLADIPRRYVAFVMSDVWDGVHDMLLKRA